MSDSRKKKRAAKQDTPQTASKTDISIAKYLRNKCPKKQTLLMNQKVYYFIGTKAVDTLMESKWTTGTKKEPAIFHTREDCVDFLSRLREMELFARAEKITVKKVEPKKSKKGAKKNDDEDEKGDDSSKEKRDKKDKDDKGDKAVVAAQKKEKGSKDEKSGDTAKDDKGLKKRKNNKDKDEKLESDADPESPKVDAKDVEKKKKKIRLELHPVQGFYDNSDAYVWIYEPTSIKNILLGTGIILGAIGLCLFPLWPPFIRQGVYYLSLVAIGLIGLLIAVSLFRYVVFGIVWALTMGKLHFWYLPNLTEDCGFFESFAPLYVCSKGGEKDNRSKKKGKKSKDKDSDKEEKDSDKENGNSDKETAVQEKDQEKADTDKDKDDTGSEPEKEPDENSAENDKDSNGSYVMVSN